MTYIPYTGNFSQYGFGPEHSFFDSISAPIGGTGGQAATPPPNPYDSNNNPYVGAYEQGRHSTTEGGAGTSQQSNDPGKNDWEGAKQAMANLAGFAAGPFSSALGVGLSMGRGRNSAGTGILGALGINPFGAASTMSPLAYQQSVRDMMGAPLGQTTGSASQDFFGAINDLSTVGQLGAVLDARDNNRTGNPPPGGYAQFGDFAGGDPAQGGRSDYAGPGTGTGTASDFSGFSGFSGGDPGAQSGGSSDTHGAQADAQSPDNPGGMYAAGGYFRGATGGQDDKVPALLSDGEYVIDAPTVAALGGGNNEAGAKALDRFRAAIRKISHGTTEQPRPVDIGEAFRAASRAS